jgi:hypothetical protein
VNDLVIRHENICATDANDPISVSKFRVRSHLTEIAFAEVTGMVSAPKSKRPLH